MSDMNGAHGRHVHVEVVRALTIADLTCIVDPKL